MPRLTRCCLVALVLLLAGTAPWQMLAQEDEPAGLPRRAMGFLAGRHGIAGSGLRVAYRLESHDPLSGRPLTILKIVDSATGRIYPVVLEASGESTLAERAARWRPALRRRGALAQSLVAGRPTTSAEPMPVIVWVRGPARVAPAGTAPAMAARASRDVFDTPDQVQRHAARVDRDRADALAPIVTPVVTRLRARGRTAAASPLSPAIAVALTPSELAEVGAWPEVDRIFFDELAEPELRVARASLGASIVNNRDRNGTGVRIAMIEVGGRIASNPHLELTQDSTSVCAGASTHSTAVAGMINSSHPVNHGVAAGALLWAGGSCLGLSSQLQNRSTAAGDWGARAINLSWGASATLVPGANDRFYDDMVANRRIFVVKSSGNRAGPCQGDAKLTSPALGYNLLTVGGYDDRNSVAWADDIMDDCSSYVNPSSLAGDREKPEVVAPSMNLDSTTTDGGTGLVGSGTSWASGLVTGAAALLMHRDPTLQVWPESLKAILMATAVHNIEGDRRLSDKDGAGGLSIDRADDVTKRSRGNWDGVSFTCDASLLAPPVDVEMALIAGRRTRAVIVWDTDPAYEGYDQQPGSDLDMTVLAPLGGTVASSASLDNTYEIVDFVPASSGTYTLRITTSRCDWSPQHLGWAWWRAG